MEKHDMTDVVVLLPGIMGSELSKAGAPVWDIPTIRRAFLTLGGSLETLRLRSDASKGDGVTATGLLSDGHLVPFFWKVDGYGEIARYVTKHFNVVPGQNFFEFPYDWRLDNRIAARALKEATGGWLEKWRQRQRSGEARARLILICHSMGGLVARHFLEVLGGWRDTKLLVTLGTPHRGSVKALDYLVNGYTKKVGSFTLADITDVVSSFPSVYQLLPTYECVGKTEDDLSELQQLRFRTLGRMELERAREGIAFHDEINSAVEKNSKLPEYRDRRTGYWQLPVVGTFQPTFQSALITSDGVKPLYTHKRKERSQGDGTVPRQSATPLELRGLGHAHFAWCPHASLQNFDPVRIQVRSQLADDLYDHRGPDQGPEALSLEIADAFVAGERVEARASCAVANEPMQATLTNLDTKTASQHEFSMVEGQSWQELSVPSLPAGRYRIRVQSTEQVQPIDDLFVVVGRAAAN